MIPALQANSQISTLPYRGRFPKSKTVIGCIDMQSSFVDSLVTKKKETFAEKLKNIFYELFPYLDSSYRKLQLNRNKKRICK